MSTKTSEIKSANPTTKQRMKKNLIALSALLTIAAVIRHLIPNPCQTPLYRTVLLSQDRNQIFDYFEANGISYEWIPERQQILVQKEQVQGLRRLFFYRGLPTGVTRRSPSPFGRTAWEQKVIAQQLLEGEIASLLRSLPGIDDAMVKLSVPEKCCYPPPEGEKTNARVFILHHDPIDPYIWPSLKHYMQMVVTDPEIGGLTVIDTQGKELYTGGFDPPEHSSRSVQD